MSEILSKRELGESFDSASKRQEVKKISKPGRKPLATEPKNKRTAQNRAAQRAFRERKEKKMKDLEDKILSLEDEKKSASTEAEFLKVQVQLLMSELAKYRGTKDLSDLNLPKLGHLKQQETTPGSDVSSILSPNGSDLTSRSSNSEKTPSFSFEFPWSRKNSINSKQSPNNSNHSSVNLPGLSSDTSTTSSNESSPFELYNNEEQQDLPLFNQGKDSTSLDIKSNSINREFQFNEHFDEGISDFCNDLNSACGTKEAPIPRAKSQASTPLEQAKTVSSLSFDHKEDPLSFLNDSQFTTFDPSLAFNEDDQFNNLFDDQNLEEPDPIAQLTTEESLYDPFGLFAPIQKPTEKDSGSVVMNDSSPTQLQTEPSIDQEEVVPSKDARYMKCTEIWDRITSHPKYSDIDIDGLCTELRAKAKCSDKGVVIDYADVNKVIMRSIPNKKAN